ncbi:hypothetical protein AA0114_g5410 [Alternaria tenuissima]|uniref:Heterokaryon incompatibility domain-containing protein n=1 Tax=Alternaria tenuissima TaxID=119927 RepID=A0A4Q4MJF6_9PLEO|nr:hypothetical protein AA0114_g5410 [Alternaria tenuissima]
MAYTQANDDCVGKFYKHQPLDSEKHQIRLLKLRNSSEDTVDYRLITFDFESAPSYVALSYTWGDERPTGSVSIDGKEFEIRMNLLNFLRTYEVDGYLWVDQISIDQSNPEERNHQVKMMWKIYSRCDYVLVWLRNETTCTPSTNQAALDFNNGVQSYLKHGRREDGSSDDKKSFDWPTLAPLHNSYFDRLWIVQELLLSKHVRILVEGNVWILWESLRTKREELGGKIQRILPSTSRMVDAQLWRHTFDRHIVLSEMEYITITVSDFCDKKCRDPRDKVYGLMALVQPSSQVEVDYTKSTHQVFLDAVMSMVREYWYMRREPSDGGYKFYRVKWTFGKTVESLWSLAQAMGFTDLEKSGFRSFVECIWERILRYEVTAKSHGLQMDAETRCITSVGYEPEKRQVSVNERLEATCNRWWYRFEGNRYYHDCKEWSGKAKLQEYTVPEDVRYSKPGLGKKLLTRNDRTSVGRELL